MKSNPINRSEEWHVIPFAYPIVDTLSLKREFNPADANLFDVLNRRRSYRVFESLTVEEVSAILWFSSKVKTISVELTGYISTQRPSASAGARHPIDILVASKFHNSLFTLFYYNPFDHSLSKLSIDEAVVDEFIVHLRTVINFKEGTILWFVAHPDRTEAKYENFQSLIWRDAGALIHSVQIACTAFNFRSCPFGTLAEPFVSRFFSSPNQIFSAGGIIVG